MMEACKYCDGNGRIPWKDKDAPIPDEECPACHGAGKVERQKEEHELDYR